MHDYSRLNHTGKPIHMDYEKKSTNNTLLFYQGKKKPTYYLPVYTQLKVISISNVKHIEMSATLNVEIKITISYREVDLNIKNKILQKGIRLCFENDHSQILKRDNPNVFLRDNQRERSVEFTVRRFLVTRMDCPSIIWTPFQTIECRVITSLRRVKLSVKQLEEDFNKSLHMDKKQVKEILHGIIDIFPHQQPDSEKVGIPQNHISDAEGRKKSLIKTLKWLQKYQQGAFQFHFNMMDHPNESQKISVVSNLDFGLFKIVPSKLYGKYSKNKFTQEDLQNKQRSLKQNKKGFLYEQPLEQIKLHHQRRKNLGNQIPNSFNFAHFNVMLFKRPMVAVVTIFLPMFLLSILNLGIFFQDKDLKGRILSIGALLVSFVALVPVIRQQIPPTPKITIVQYLVFFQSITTILALFDSLDIQNQADGFSHTNVFGVLLFIISLVITCLIYFILILMVINYVCKLSMYEKKQKQLRKPEINQLQWTNAECDRQFQKDFERNTVLSLNDRSNEIHKNKYQMNDLKMHQKDSKVRAQQSQSELANPDIK